MKQIYKFKVALKYDKRTWRMLEIKPDATLDDLHQAIFEAFDRYDEHLYTFYFGDKPTSKSYSRNDDAIEFRHPVYFEERDNNFLDDYSEFYNAAKARLSALNFRVKQKFEYLFDYGDNWWHEITFEGKVDDDGGQYPRVSASKGISPPQYDNYDDDDYWDDEHVIVLAEASDEEVVVEEVKLAEKARKKPKKKAQKAKKKAKKKTESKFPKSSVEAHPDLFSWENDKNE